MILARAINSLILSCFVCVLIFLGGARKACLCFVSMTSLCESSNCRALNVEGAPGRGVSERVMAD